MLVTEDVSGNQLTRAPKLQIAASADYVRQVGSLTVSLGAAYRRQGGVFFLETNQDAPTFRNRPWNEIDLRAAIAGRNSSWELAAFVHNLTDDRHVTAVTALGGFPNAAINEPRRWGVEAVVRF